VAKSATVRFLVPQSYSFYEASWVRVRQISLLALRRLTHSENVFLDGQGTAAIIAMNVLRVLTYIIFISLSVRFGNHLADFLESFRFFRRMA
jgi:hypothetical protein